MRRFLILALALVASSVVTPTASAHHQAAPIFGVNMSFYDANDHIVADKDTRRLFRSWGTPFVRIPSRSGVDDATTLKAMRAVRDIGATPMLILRSPVSGDIPFQLAENRRLVRLLHQVFGDRTAYLEYGNEPDLGGVSAEDYRTAWNVVVPELKRLFPKARYKFVGPALSRVDGAHADYIATFLDGANPLPDYLSWHEYVCNASDDWDEVCVGHLANWAKHVENVESKVSATIGKDLPFFISEWNVDPNHPSPLYSDATRIKDWTTKALAQLKALGPNLAGAMIYTGTDHGDFALVKDSTTVTPQGEAFRDAGC